MTDQETALRELMAKGSDASVLREMRGAHGATASPPCA